MPVLSRVPRAAPLSLSAMAHRVCVMRPYPAGTLAVCVRPAEPADCAAVRALLLEAAQWVTATHGAMWEDSELTPEHVAAAVCRGDVFLATTRSGGLAGSLHLTFSDPDFWPDAPNDAAYVHRLVVPRAFKGQGVMGAMIAWAIDMAVRLNRRAVRLDCDADRAKLRAAYEGAGFTFHSYREVYLAEHDRLVRAARYEYRW